jgi:SNF2 family DNA or RNA helicase
MIEFVYPNFLGTLEEFKELFEQPIQKGQCLESSQDAVRLMKERVYILHSELNQIVHRRDDTTLTKILPRMEEHVLMLQQQLYQKAISHLRDSAPNPLKHVSIFMGCVGKDNFSEILAEKAKSDGVDVRYQLTDKESTSSYPIFMIGN